ncbi:ankyrin repeat domain-containing protein [Planctomycetaceae bacterium SH139]
MAKKKTKQRDPYQDWLEEYGLYLEEAKCKRTTKRFLKRMPHFINDHRVFFDTVRDNRMNIFTAFLDSGTDVNLRDAMGYTALNAAVASGNLKMARMLLEQRADPDLGAPITELDNAETSNRIRMFQLLIEYGVDVNQVPSERLAHYNLFIGLEDPENDEDRQLFELLKKHGGRKPKKSDVKSTGRGIIASDPLPAAIKKWKSGRKKSSFEVSGDGLKNLKPLAELTELASLTLDGGGIKNYSPLKNLTRLKFLSLRSDSHSSLAPLSELHQLEELHITDGAVKNLSPLKKLHKLKTISFSWCAELSSIAPLSALPRLETLTFYECPGVLNLKPLAKCLKIRALKFIDCYELSDVKPLAALSNLRELTLSNTAVEDVTVLARLKKLKIRYKE